MQEVTEATDNIQGHQLLASVAQTKEFCHQGLITFLDPLYLIILLKAEVNLENVYELPQVVESGCLHR
jgi:hypothetical protein